MCKEEVEKWEHDCVIKQSKSKLKLCNPNTQPEIFLGVLVVIERRGWRQRRCKVAAVVLGGM